MKEILEAENNQERMNLRPTNVSPFEWRRFVKQKTSPEFKVTFLNCDVIDMRY